MVKLSAITAQFLSEVLKSVSVIPLYHYCKAVFSLLYSNKFVITITFLLANYYSGNYLVCVGLDKMLNLTCPLSAR